MKIHKILTISCLLLINKISLIASEHILFLLTCSSYSHRVANWPLAEALLAKGHHVTFISPYGPPVSTGHANWTEIIPSKLKAFMDDVIKNNFNVHHRAYGIVPPMFLVLDYFCFSACQELYRSPEVKQWLATNPKVDLIIGDMYEDCNYGFSEKFDAKNILYMPLPFVTRHFEAFGINPETHSVPDYDVTRPVPLNFLNRVTGALLPLYYRLMEIIFYSKYQNLFKEELGITNIPNVYDIREKTSLIITNGDYITDYARSFPPFVVKVPGIHVKNEHNKLDKAIEKFIDSNDAKGNKSEGFIYMSFGTVAKGPSLPLDIRETFFKSIQAFPNIKFIWVWDGENPSEYPANLLLVRWINQQDVLGHPKIKAFITQSGRPSNQEALYNGVPTITFPVLCDQDFNAQRVENLGTSIGLEIVGISEDKLKDAISKILTDQKYRTRAVQIAKLAKDVPVKPVDLAIWWVEFVLRHPSEELTLMKSNSRHLTWFQKRELDIWLFILICIIGSIGFWYYVCSKIYTRCSQKNIVNTPTNGKLKSS